MTVIISRLMTTDEATLIEPTIVVVDKSPMTVMRVSVAMVTLVDMVR